MAINFPTSPTTNDIHSEDNLSWKFNGTSWIALPTPSVAGNVVYTPAGTGAVATDVETKLRESVSVKDFGAVGDGVADDSVAINNADAYVSSLGGGEVHYPAGTYLVGRYETNTDSGTQHLCIRVSSNVSHIGAGVNRTTIKVKDGADAHCFYSYNESNCLIEGFTINGNEANQAIQNPSTGNDPAGIIVIGLAGTPVSNYTIKDVYIHDTCDYGIGFEGSITAVDCLIENVHLDNVGADGFDCKGGTSVATQPTRNRIKNMTVTNMSARGTQGVSQAALNPRGNWSIDGLYVDGLSDDCCGIRYNEGDAPAEISGGYYNTCSNFFIRTSTPEQTIGIMADTYGVSYSNGVILGVNTAIQIRHKHQSFSNIHIADFANDGITFVDNTPSFSSTPDKCSLSNITLVNGGDLGVQCTSDDNLFSNVTVDTCGRGVVLSGANNNLFTALTLSNITTTEWSDTTGSNNYRVTADRLGGEFTLTSSGLVAEQTLTAKYSVNGSQVTLYLPTFGGITDASTFVLSSIPTELRPSISSQQFPVRVKAGSSSAVGLLMMTTGGNINIYPDIGGGAWGTSTTEKKLFETAISYIL